jgi:ubiquinone biosynthesis protein
VLRLRSSPDLFLLEVRRAFAFARTASVLALQLAFARDGRSKLPVRLRLALERLGLTYVKLGQYLAMRFDVLPADVCRELGKLFDEVAPLPFAHLRPLIEAELGQPIERAFARFDETPLAAASVAQVHEAWTVAEERVAVKVQRPGIEKVFVADVRVLHRLVWFADRLHLLGRMSATEMLDEFVTWTRREFDFLQEGRMAERVGQNPAPYEVEPRVHWERSTASVLTLEFVDGVSLAQIVRIVEEEGQERLGELYPDIDVDLVLHHLTYASLRQIFVNGLFHGDPHPGNIIVLPDNRIAFIDFGIFGELSRHDRELLSRQVEQLALGNIDESLRAYTQQLTITDESDPAAFRAEARAVLQRWHAVSADPHTTLEEKHVGGYIGRMIDISRRNRLVYDMRYLLYWRALNALDSTALRISKSFDLMQELRAFFEEVRPGAGERLAIALRAPRTWMSVAELAREVPPRAERMVADLAAGRFETATRAAEARGPARARSREATRVAASVASVGGLVVVARANLPDPTRLVALLLALPATLLALAAVRRA